MVKGSSFRDKKDLIDIGYLKSERLVNLSKHDYRLEPNVTFSPDMKWVRFPGPTCWVRYMSSRSKSRRQFIADQGREA